MIEDELERPGLKQAQADFREQRQKGGHHQPAKLANMRPKVSRDPPETWQTFLERFRARHGSELGSARVLAIRYSGCSLRAVLSQGEQTVSGAAGAVKFQSTLGAPL